MDMFVVGVFLVLMLSNVPRYLFVAVYDIRPDFCDSCTDRDGRDLILTIRVIFVEENLGWRPENGSPVEGLLVL